MAQLVKTVAGLAIASVKTVNGLAIASVKTVNGLDNTSGGGGGPSDDFNRADGTLGANWTTVTGATAFGIVSNKAVPTNLSNDCAAVWNADTAPNDQFSQAVLTSTGSSAGNGPGVIVRGSAAGETYYRAIAAVSGGNNIEVGKMAAGGSYTQIAIRTATFVDGDILKLAVTGTTLRVFVNGVQAGADITDATYSSGQYGIGYSSTSTTATVDTWSAGAYP